MTKVIDFVVTWVDVNNEIYLDNSTKINYNLHVFLTLIFVNFHLEDLLRQRRNFIIGLKRLFMKSLKLKMKSQFSIIYYMLIFKKGRLNFQSLRDLIPFMLFLINQSLPILCHLMKLGIMLEMNFNEYIKTGIFLVNKKREIQ